MATISNSYAHRTLIGEMNSILLEFFEVTKVFVYKYHKYLGYF